MMNKEEVNDYLSIKQMTQWVVNEQLNDQELGRKLRGHYWEVRDVLRNEK